MSVCITQMPNGNNILCQVNPSKVKNILITQPDYEFDSLADVMNQKTWKDIVNVDMTGYIPGGLTSYAPTTDDPNIVTAENTTIKTITSFPVPSAQVFLSSNNCDFNEIARQLRGNTAGIVYIHEDGTVKLEKTEDGKYKPLLAEVTGIVRGIAEPSDVNNNFPMWIHHKDYDAFLQAGLFKPLFNVNTVLTKSTPVGLSMSIVDPYIVATGIVRVSITERCSPDAVTGAEAAPYEYTVTNSSYLNTPIVGTVIVVAGQDDQYDIVLNKDVVPAPMASGESIEFEVRNVASTIVSEISNRLLVTAP